MRPVFQLVVEIDASFGNLYVADGETKRLSFAAAEKVLKVVGAVLQTDHIQIGPVDAHRADNEGPPDQRGGFEAQTNLPYGREQPLPRSVGDAEVPDGQAEGVRIEPHPGDRDRAVKRFLQTGREHCFEEEGEEKKTEEGVRGNRHRCHDDETLEK